MKIQKNKCSQCLFSKNKIVSNNRMKSIINACIYNDTFFICHKTQVTGSNEQICCRGFWDKYKNNFNLGRISQRLGTVQEVSL
jgi:hypothetical protein